MDMIYNICGSLILAISLIYVWHNLLGKKANYTNIRSIVTIICLTILTIYNYFLVNKFIKVVVITFIFMIFFRYLFKETIQKCVITPIYYQIIIMLSELIFAFIIILFNNSDNQLLLNSYLGTFLTNIMVAIISVIISKIKIIKKIYNKILEFTDRIKPIQLCVFCFIVIIIINVVLASTFYDIEYKYLFIINTIIILISFIIVFYSFKTQNKYNKVSDKYNVAINSLKDLENMISKNRVDNHENKNLLLTVRSMIVNKEKNIPEYIDSILEEKYNDDEQLLQKMSVIPSGGLRATIYSEILKIKDNNISYALNIEKGFKTIDFIEMKTNTVIDVCKIIGVLIDNAIDEVKKISKGIILIDLFSDKEKINIKISNNYKTKVAIDKIFDEGYSTKGENHGYGLTLVKNILDNNPSIEIETSINKEVFGQTLSIKNKKMHK